MVWLYHLEAFIYSNNFKKITMDTSVTIIGLAILFLILIPFFYMIRSQFVNRAKIKKILEGYSLNHYNFSLTETQNKKVLAIDEAKKGFVFIDQNPLSEQNWFVDLNEVKFCKLVTTTESNSEAIVKIEFLFHYNKVGKDDLLVPFYRVENDQMGQVCLYEDHLLAVKWQMIIEECILR